MIGWEELRVGLSIQTVADTKALAKLTIALLSLPDAPGVSDLLVPEISQQHVVAPEGYDGKDTSTPTSMPLAIATAEASAKWTQDLRPSKQSETIMR